MSVTPESHAAHDCCERNYLALARHQEDGAKIVSIPENSALDWTRLCVDAFYHAGYHVNRYVPGWGTIAKIFRAYTIQ
jgi:hypothetical protein